MKIFNEKNVDNNVEVLLNYQELEKMVNVLKKFQEGVNVFKTKNKGNSKLGFTHLHFKDYELIDKNSSIDLVIYLNLDE